MGESNKEGDGAGMTWGSAVEEAWKDVGGNTEKKCCTMEKLGEYQGRNKRNDTRKIKGQR